MLEDVGLLASWQRGQHSKKFSKMNCEGWGRAISADLVGEEGEVAAIDLRVLRVDSPFAWLG